MSIFSKPMPEPSAPPMKDVLTGEEVIAFRHGENLLEISKNNRRICPDYSYEQFVEDHIDDYCIEYGVRNNTARIREYVENRLNNMNLEIINNM